MPVKKPKSIGKASTARPSRRRAPVADLAPAVWDENIREDRELDTPERIEARPVMLLVVGPHRSGTSVAARALECLGAVNSPNLMPANEANPKGYFEDNDIYLFNDRVLMPALGRAWYSTCPVDWTVLSKAERSRLGLQALEIVRRNYPLGNAVSVLKEPRISALLPFWLSVLQHAGFAVRLVGAVRDPLSVARSLRQRDGFSLTHGGMLYLMTWISILQQSGETTLAFISFEDLLANPSKALRRASDRLQLTLPADFESRAAGFAAGHVDRDLCHSIVDPNDVSLEPDLPPAVTDLFAGLREAVLAQNPRRAGKAVAAAERLVQAMLPALGDFDRVFWERLQERQTARGASEQLQQQVHAFQARVQELEQSSSALQHQLQSASAPQELATLRAQAEALQVTASEKGARLEALTAELAARDTRLQEVQAQLDTLRSENSELVTRHQSLVSSHEELVTRHTSHVASHDDLTGRLAALEAQNQEVAARQAVADDERQRLAAERDNLAAQLESLRLEHSDLVTRHTTLVTSQEELATTHEDLVTRHTPLVTSHEDLSTRYQQLETAYAELTARHTSMVTSGSDLSARLDALEAQRQEAVARCATSIEEQRRVLAERDQLAAEVESLRSEHSALVTRHQSLVTASQQRGAEYSELATRHQSLATAHEDLVTAHESLDTAHAKLIARNAALEAERSELVARRQMLASNLQSLEGKHSNSAKEVAELRSRLERAEQQRKEATVRAQSAERDLRKSERAIEHLQALLVPLEKFKDEHDQLEAKIALLAAAREKLVAEKDDLASRLGLAEADRDQLQQNIDERFEESAKLTKRLVASEQQRAQAEKDHQSVLTRLTQSEVSCRELGSELASARQDCDNLRSNVQERYEELAKLTRRLVQTEEELVANRNELRNLTASTSWRLTEPLRRFRGGSNTKATRSGLDLLRDCRLIKESGLFDRTYYLRINPDVARLKIDPIRHYVMHGASEGRNPSAEFNTRDYLRSHPELLADPAVPNPLVHFIRTRTGRSSKPNGQV